jgi:hypothetical protein
MCNGRWSCALTLSAIVQPSSCAASHNPVCCAALCLYCWLVQVVGLDVQGLLELCYDPEWLAVVNLLMLCANTLL